MIPRPVIWSNCPFSTMYLLIRGEVRGIRMVRNDAKGLLYSILNWTIFVTRWHFIVETRRKHLVHFNHVLRHQHNPFGPFWFVGQLQGVSRRRQSPVLNRKELRRLGPLASWVLFSAMYCGFFIPWAIGWACYWPYWSAWWACQAYTKRRARYVR